MMSPRMGNWWVYSDKDPRWNKSGRANLAGVVIAGGPEVMKSWIAECRQKFGEPPDDCTQGCIKD